jgi:cytochrome c peroxidase
MIELPLAAACILRDDEMKGNPKPILRNVSSARDLGRASHRRLRFCVVALFAGLLITGLSGRAGGGPGDDASRERVRLGARLFNDDRFSSPNGDLPASCSHCHLFDQDPQGLRAYTDFLARSWVSWRSGDPRRDGLRNAPTILDSAEMPLLHYDGEFESLEDLVKGTLSGRTLGWLPGERDQAFQLVRRVVNGEAGEGPAKKETYRSQFRKAFGVELSRLGVDETIELVARAVSDYVRTLRTRRNSPYDAFIRTNALEAGPLENEPAQVFAKRMLAHVSELEARNRLKLPEGFTSSALEGMKIFLRTSGERSTGNCVSCHAPPRFTDLSFHNIGVSQIEYDRVHGEGEFAGLSIPDAGSAVRPSAQFRETPARDKPGVVDLGYWNFVDLARSPMRRSGESDAAFLDRTIGAFKTPTLRNLAFSQPYMHNGSIASLEGVLIELMRVSDLARTGRVRSADDELRRVRLVPEDVPALTEFLNALNEDLRPGYRSAR